MDILAAMSAYLVCVTGLVAGLVMSFVVFFSPAGQFLPPPSEAVAMVASPSHAAAAPIAPVKTVARTVAQTAAKTGRSGEEIAAAVPADDRPVAIDARQRPLFSQAHLRRLADKQRARQLAYREHSSFETRFLHFED
jgi:hypothetical protein